MADFLVFLRDLLETGTVRLSQRPALAPGQRTAAEILLSSAHADLVYDIAGPAVGFVPARAVACAEWVALACWFLVSRKETADQVEAALAFPPGPTSAADHVSGDLTLRFLPGVLRRARAASACDVFPGLVETMLRRWPLSGVLADIAAPPERVDFQGHPGLALLYAERLALRPRVGWVLPQLQEVIELVFAGRGIPIPQAIKLPEPG